MPAMSGPVNLHPRDSSSADGTGGCRCPAASRHPAWFHLAMRVQHAAQCASGWPDATARGRSDGARFAEAVEHIRWRLWHGQTMRALRLIQRILVAVKTKAEGKTAAARS